MRRAFALFTTRCVVGALLFWRGRAAMALLTGCALLLAAGLFGHGL
jgi:hypothetical protein